MLFLRNTLLFIVVLGVLVYLIATRIRAEFFKMTGKSQPLFRSHSAEFKTFCKSPPADKVASLLKLKKKLSTALVIAAIAFLLAILSVAI
jgi:hypothetical protein